MEAGGGEGAGGGGEGCGTWGPTVIVRPHAPSEHAPMVEQVPLDARSTGSEPLQSCRTNWLADQSGMSCPLLYQAMAQPTVMGEGNDASMYRFLAVFVAY